MPGVISTFRDGDYSNVVDKRIGDAYLVVKYVQENLPAIITVSEGFAAVAANSAAAIAAKDAAEADAIQTAADRVQTALDVITTTAQAVIATTQAGLATTNGEAQVDLAEAQVALATAKAVLTAADRVQTGLDALATAADRVQTGLDLVAVQAAVSAGVGSLAVQTLAALNAITTAPTSSLGYVTNDSTSTNNGLYQWNGTVWTKSIYDPLTQAKVYADDLSAKNVIKVADAISADASKNLYNTTNDTADFYITDATSQTPGIVKSLNGARLQKIAVTAGESYLFSASALSGVLSLSFSADPNISANKSVTLATVITVSSSVKKLVVPAGMNYLFFNTKFPSLSFDVTASLIVNKFNSSFIGYGEAVIADEKAREAIAILETEAVMNSDIAATDYFPNLAVNPVPGFYISAVGSAFYGKIASSGYGEIQVFSVEAGKKYAIYSTNYNNTLFTLAVSATGDVVGGKQLTPLSLTDTGDPNVKLFTVPEGASYAFATTLIQHLSFDVRSVFWVNEGEESTKNDVPTMSEIKGLQVRDLLAQQRLDNLNIVQTSVLKDKKWIAIGDSITEKNMRADKNYHDFIREDVGGMTVYNKGISGSGFHDRMTVADTLTQQNPDYITIFWGTNDFGLVRNTYPLGTFMNSDENTISGRINTCLNALMTKYPLAKIAIISALPCLTNYGSNAAPNSVGYTLKQHVDLLKQYAAHYSLPFLNLYEQSNLPVWIPAANQHYFTAPTLTTPDGLHPNDAGQRVMADKIKAFLESI